MQIVGVQQALQGFGEARVFRRYAPRRCKACGEIKCRCRCPIPPRPPRPEPPGQTTIWGALARSVRRPAPVELLEVQPDAEPATELQYRRPALRASKRLRRVELAFKREIDEGPPLPPMPASDVECEAAGLGTEVPCPFVACRYNLSIEVTPRGSLRVLYPWWEPGVRVGAPTCALVEARKGEHTAGRVGAMMGIGVNRVGQIEASATAKLAARFGMLPEELARALEAARRERNED